MMMWWVMICGVIPQAFTSWFTINKEVFLFYPVFHPIKLHIHCLGTFYLTAVVTMPSDAELSVLIGVDGWRKASSWSVIHRGTVVCPLWNSPPTFDLDADATKCFRILHLVFIGPFSGGRRFRLFSGRLVASSGNSALQWSCMPMVLIGMMHRCQCEVSYF